MGWYPGKILREALSGQEVQIPAGKAGLLMRIERDISDESDAEREYSDLAKWLEAAGFSVEANIVREIRDQEKMHGIKLLDILYMVKQREWRF